MTPTTLAAAMHRAGVGQHHNSTGSPYPYRNHLEEAEAIMAELDEDKDATTPSVDAQPVEPLSAKLRALAALRRKATPGHWYRYTIGHRSVRQAAGAVTTALFAVDVTPDVRSLMTDLSWVQTDAEEVNIALTGNGPKQTENADYIAAAGDLSPDELEQIAATLDAARAGDGLDVDRLAQALQMYLQIGDWLNGGMTPEQSHEVATNLAAEYDRLAVEGSER